MNTLTDAILNLRKDMVLQKLKAGESPNQLDVYGFYPLSEAAIANSVEISALLLAHGADVNQKDLVGGTPLHWAAENNNLQLAELLLDKGADPNAYYNSGQPVLVYPILRHQKEMQVLLCQYGADRQFAQDYISTKLIGHRFELAGRVDIVDHKNVFIEIDFSGFVLEFSLSAVLDSLMQLKNNFAGRDLRPYFEDLETVIAGFVTACELVRYQHYLTNSKIDKYTDRLAELAQSTCVLLPVGCAGHAITFVKYKDLLAKCDRGANSKTHPSVEIFRIGRPRLFNAEFLKNFLYKRQNRYSVSQGIHTFLDLRAVDEIKLPSQLTGNCSWANVEATIPTIIFMRRLYEDGYILHEEQQGHLLPHIVHRDMEVRIQDTEAQEAALQKAKVARHKKEALKIYQSWLLWDHDWALHHCIDDFYEADPARRASRAAILGAVLAQTCKHNRHDDMEVAYKILAVLATPEYRYVLDTYLRVYKRTPVAENLKELLDLYGTSAHEGV